MDVLVVVGTRPEVVKMAPVIRAPQKYKQPFTFVRARIVQIVEEV